MSDRDIILRSFLGWQGVAFGPIPGAIPRHKRAKPAGTFKVLSRWHGLQIQR
jgi:hypothetical protein